jgi:hypothetical protein
MNIKSLIAFLFVLGISTTAFGQETELESLDTNENGIVSLDEFKEYVKGKLPEFEQLDDFAKKVDADENGKISQEEFDGRMEKLAAIMEMRDAPNDETEEEPDNSHDGSDEDIEAAEEAYKKISELIGEKSWEALPEHMTEKACDDFCSETVMMGLAFAKMEMPMQIPGLSEAKDDVTEVIETYGLDELDIDITTMMKMRVQTDEEDDEDLEAPKKDKRAEAKTKILAAIDEDDRRWEIVAAVWEAQSSSPLMISAVNGEIKETELDDDVCFLTIKMKPPEAAGGGIQIQIQSPPSIVRMEKVDESWTYAGRDPERTERAMKEFMQNLNLGRGRPKTDF